MKVKKIINTYFLIISCCISNSVTGVSSINNQSIESNQVTKFAKHIEESIQNGNPSFLNKSFDFDSFMQKIYSIYESDDEYEFNHGFLEGFKANFDIGSMIIDEIKKDGSYTFLRSYSINGSSRLLFRLMSENGINYHEYEIKQHEGNTEIVDIFLFHSGEYISESIGGVYETFLLLNTKETMDPKVEATIYSEIQKINSFISKGKNRKAFKYWLNLPDETRHLKSFLIAGLKLAQSIDEEKFEMVYNDFQNFFPDNQSKYLIPVEGFILYKNYSKALTCIDSLDSRLGTDPMLNFLRGKILFEAGNHIEAANSFNNLIQSIPEFENGYISLLQLYIKDKNYLEATEILDKMVSNLEYYKGSMNNYLSNYPDFYQSNEYQIWLNQ